MRVSNRISVYYWVMVSFFLIFGMSSLSIAARQDNRSEWSKSAKSLTIFQPGNAVRILVWDLDKGQDANMTFSRDYPINPDGYIIMPLIGEVRVKGLTSFELMQNLEERFSAYFINPYVYVRPLIRVTMQGAFNQPGSYRADPQSSLWDLVRQAGGPTANCDLPNIRVERGGTVIMKKILESFERGYSLEEIGIESGDQIIAPARGGMTLQVIIMVVNLFASVMLLYLRLKRGW